MDKMPERDKAKYSALKDAARRMEKLSVYILAVCFFALIACAVLTDKLGGYYFIIGIAVFSLAIIGTIIAIIAMNHKIKGYEEKFSMPRDAEREDE